MKSLVFASEFPCYSSSSQITYNIDFESNHLYKYRNHTTNNKTPFFDHKYMITQPITPIVFGNSVLNPRTASDSTIINYVSSKQKAIFRLPFGKDNEYHFDDVSYWVIQLLTHYRYVEEVRKHQIVFQIVGLGWFDLINGERIILCFFLWCVCFKWNAENYLLPAPKFLIEVSNWMTSLFLELD